MVKRMALLWPLSVCNQVFLRFLEKIECFLNDASNVIQIRNALCFSMRIRFQRKYILYLKGFLNLTVPVAIITLKSKLISCTNIFVYIICWFF